MPWKLKKKSHKNCAETSRLLFDSEKNQFELHRDTSEYMDNLIFQNDMKTVGNYVKTIEKARGAIEIRKYYLCSHIEWLKERHSGWPNLHAIEMMETIVEKRYYITSFDDGVEVCAMCPRTLGHRESSLAARCHIP